MLLSFDFTRNFRYDFLCFSNINYNYGILMLSKKNSFPDSYSIQICVIRKHLDFVQKE